MRLFITSLIGLALTMTIAACGGGEDGQPPAGSGGASSASSASTTGSSSTSSSSTSSGSGGGASSSSSSGTGGAGGAGGAGGTGGSGGPLPVANDDSFEVNQSQVLNNGNVLLNDVDTNGTGLTAVLDAGPSNGALTLNPDGSFSYDPDNTFIGVDSFTYHVDDGTFASAIATATVNVLPNPAPQNDAYMVNEYGTLVVDAASGVMANDAYVDSVSTMEPSVAMQPDGSFTYTPPAGYSGTFTFMYLATGALGVTLPASVTITVVNVQEPPMAWVDVTSTAASKAVTVSPLVNDIDDENDPLSLMSVGMAQAGTLSNAGNTTVDYTPNAAFRGIDFFDYRVTDSIASDVGAVAVSVDSIEKVLQGAGSSSVAAFADDSLLTLTEGFSPGTNNGPFWFAKYDAAGVMQWQRQANGIGQNMDASPDGSFAISGLFQGSITFDAGLASEIKLNGAGVLDVQGFAARFATDGTVIWAMQMGDATTCAGCERAQAIAALSNGTTVFGGTTGWTIDSAYVLAVDSTGTTAWTWTLTEDEAETYAVDALSDGSVVAAVASINGMRLIRFASNGQMTWTRMLTSGSTPRLQVLSDDRIVVTGGAMAGTVFGAGEPNQTAITGTSFLAVYTPSGTLEWVVSMQGDLGVANVLSGGDFIWIGGSGIFVNNSSETFTPAFGSEVQLLVSPAESYVARVSSTGTIRYVSKLPLKWWSTKSMRIATFSDGTVGYGGFVRGLQTFGPGELHETTVGVDATSRTAAIVRFFP